MPADDGDRSKFFPAIEKKHGGPISIWIDRLRDLGEAKYPEQIAYLREEHGFSQAHANALTMYVRGSTSSKRFKTPEDFFKSLDSQTAATAKEIFSSITKQFPVLELVIAWNQPMLCLGKQYVLGLSVSKNHITLAPFSTDVLDAFADKLSKYVVKKKTFSVPLDWKVDASLLKAIVKARMAEFS